MTWSRDNEGLVVAVQYVCGQSSVCRVQKPFGFIGCAVAMVRHKCCWNFFLARQITKTSTLFIVAPFNQGAAEITNIQIFSKPEQKRENTLSRSGYSWKQKQFLSLKDWMEITKKVKRNQDRKRENRYFFHVLLKY